MSLQTSPTYVTPLCSLWLIGDIFCLFIISGEAQQSCETNDLPQSHNAVFFIDGTTQRTDCDVRNEMDNAHKLHLLAVRDIILFIIHFQSLAHSVKHMRN